MGVVWNVLGSVLLTPPAWWILIILPAPGALSWVVGRAWPVILPKLMMSREKRCLRLTYDAPPDWDDQNFRAAILNMIRISGGMTDIVWARDGQEFGCWLLFADCSPAVFERILADLVPGGAVEDDKLPDVGEGLVMLRWDARLVEQHGPVPEPVELCQIDGVDGVRFRWIDAQTASVAIWGPRAVEVMSRWVKPGGVIPGAADKLLYPLFIGDNPWPEMARFPSSRTSHGLSSVSRIQLHAVDLRLNGTDSRYRIIVGQDAGGNEVGFTLPDLNEIKKPVSVFGAMSVETVTVLTQQLIRRRTPVLVLDGGGALSAGLHRLLLREESAGQVLVCDVERPAQSHFRLNPLWLPDDRALWPDLFSGGWQEWLRTLGVTIGGLGLAAYRHSQVAVVATAALAADRGLTLDVPALGEALETPDFLNMIGERLPDGERLLGPEIWRWWLTQGRTTSNFDTHLRLAHLRERLHTLLDLPEYRVLWRAPYLEVLEAMNTGKSLIWRLPDRRKRLRGYVTSQLLAIATLMATRSETTPIVIVLHEVAVESWVRVLTGFPGVRLLVSGQQVGDRAVEGTLLLSRLQRDDAERIHATLTGIRASDLRRLPDRRLIMWTKNGAATLDIHNA
jgi:hypothetical protein